MLRKPAKLGMLTLSSYECDVRPDRIDSPGKTMHPYAKFGASQRRMDQHSGGESYQTRSFAILAGTTNALTALFRPGGKSRRLSEFDHLRA